MFYIDKDKRTGIIIGLCILVSIPFINLNDFEDEKELALRISRDFSIGSIKVTCPGSIEKEYSEYYSCSTKWTF